MSPDLSLHNFSRKILHFHRHCRKAYNAGDQSTSSIKISTRKKKSYEQDYRTVLILTQIFTRSLYLVRHFRRERATFEIDPQQPGDYICSAAKTISLSRVDNRTIWSCNSLTSCVSWSIVTEFIRERNLRALIHCGRYLQFTKVSLGDKRELNPLGGEGGTYDDRGPLNLICNCVPRLCKWRKYLAFANVG